MTTPAIALANLQTAVNALVGQVNTKFGTINGDITGQITTAINDLRSQIIDSADGNNDTLSKVAVRIDALQDAINALDDTYATDSELAVKIADINTAWTNADGDVQTLLADKVSTTAAQAMADNAEQAANDHADAQLVTVLLGLTDAFNDGATAIASA